VETLPPFKKVGIILKGVECFDAVDVYFFPERVRGQGRGPIRAPPSAFKERKALGI